MPKAELNKSQIETVKEVLNIIEEQEEWAKSSLDKSEYTTGFMDGIRQAKYSVFKKYKYDLASKESD